MAISPERHLLSSVLRERDFQTAVAHGVTSDMFHAHPDEWDWIEAYFKRHRKVPSRTAFRQAFSEFALTPATDTGHFAQEVRRDHARYMMTSMMRDCAQYIADNQVDQAVRKMHSSIISIAAAMGTNMDDDMFSSYSDILADVEHRVERVRTHGASGIPTGFDTYDAITGGPSAGDLVVVAARLGHLKSYTLQAWALEAAMNDFTVQFDALEQTRAQVAMRIHGMLAGKMGKKTFEAMQLSRGVNFDLADYRDFLRALKDSIKGRLHIHGSGQGRVSPLQVATQIERNRPDIVFIDYIQIMSKKGNEWQDVAALSSELKHIAGEYEVPIVVAAQLNREFGLSSKSLPGAEALAQSDAIGQDCDHLIVQKQITPRILRQGLMKNRNGPGGMEWSCHFDPTKGIFKEVSNQVAQKIKLEDEMKTAGVP